MKLDSLALSDDEAAERYESFKNTDPFPSIPPSLLNSADIYSYVARTGLIYPFQEKGLKTASYTTKIGHSFIYFEEGELVRRELAKGDVFCLPKNSIGYLQSLETFRLPDYIALRFNLKIKNVHRGLLLGTGPLVDPGFEGKLLIPVHNLTNNDYLFKESEGFAWVELTKVSPHSSWHEGYEAPHANWHKRMQFPERKKFLEPIDYLLDANKGPISSSVGAALLATEQKADEAARTAERATKATRNISVVAIIAAATLVGALFSLHYMNISQDHEVLKNLRETHERLNALENKLGAEQLWREDRVQPEEEKRALR